MMRLALSSLRRDVRSVFAPLVLMTAASVLISLAMHALWSAVTPAGAAAIESAPKGTPGALVAVAIMVIFFGIGVPATITVSSVMALSIRASTRIYASWRLAGASPRQVRESVRFRAIASAVVASLVGCVLSVPLLQVGTDFLIASTDIRVHLYVSPGLWPVLGVVGFIVVVAAVGSQRPAHDASRVEPIVIFIAGSERPSPGTLRWILSGLTLAIAASFGWGLIQSSTASDASMLTIFLGFALVVLMSVSAPLFLRSFVRLWTSALCLDRYPLWFLARRYTLSRLAATGATVIPLAIAASMLGVFFSVLATWRLTEQQELAGADSNTVQGLILFGPGAALAGLAAVANLFTMHRSRDQYEATLRSAGAGKRTLYLAGLFEALIYALSALMLAGAIAGMTTVLFGISRVLSGARFAFVLDVAALFAVVLVGFATILVSVLWPTSRGLRRSIVSSLRSG